MSKTVDNTNAAAFWDWLKNRNKPAEAETELEYLYAEIPLPPKVAPDASTETVTTEVNFEVDTTIDLENSPTKTVPGKEIVFKF